MTVLGLLGGGADLVLRRLVLRALLRKLLERLDKDIVNLSVDKKSGEIYEIGGGGGGIFDQDLYLEPEVDMTIRFAVELVIVRPLIAPLALRMVSASKSACVGCSCAPSPALITEPSTLRASSSTAPEAWCRTTRISGCMAFSVTAVSISVSPLRIEDEDTDMCRQVEAAGWYHANAVERIAVNIAYHRFAD